jgi:CRP/FNR family transcriptional regulator, cyclic AMP receptor protein
MSSLRRIPFLAPLDDERLAALEQQCSWKKYGETELIIDFGDQDDDVYFVIEGRVRVLYRAATGKEFIFADVTSGQFFGDISAIDGQPRSANVTTLQPSQLGIMPGGVFRQIVLNTPDLSRGLLEVFAARVRALNTRLAEHTFLNASQRLYAELIRLSRPRADGSSTRIISPPPFEHELAARIGTRRESVSRELALLARDGLVEKTRGGLVLTDPRELNRRIAAGSG